MFQVVLIGYVWPEVVSSAAGLRTMNLIDSFLGADWKVIVASHSKKNEFSEKLEQRGIPTKSISPNDPEFDEWIGQVKPDFVVFDRFVIEEQFGWRVEEQCPDAVRIIDTQDLHFLRRGRKAALRGQKGNFEDGSYWSDDASRELGAILRSDCSLILSDFEYALLREKFKVSSDLLYLSRFHYPQRVEVPSFEERKDLVMIGNFRHEPNVDALRWLHSEIWPLIQEQLPEAQVHIYGAYPSKEVMNLSCPKKGFFVQGFAQNQFETLQKFRVNLAPLRFGAGIKGKISDGWWAGTPAVSTSVGAEGMTLGAEFGGLVEDTSVGFAHAVAKLYRDKELWIRTQERGFSLIDSLYSQEIYSKSLVSHFAEIKASLAERRKSNWLGLVLRHHAYKSTKYFSKWIEEKNRSPISTPSDL